MRLAEQNLLKQRGILTILAGVSEALDRCPRTFSVYLGAAASVPAAFPVARGRSRRRFRP
jgi:hypothetical protein